MAEIVEFSFFFFGTKWSNIFAHLPIYKILQFAITSEVG